MIYPTPLKQNQSLGSPYSDIIREFQTKLALQNTVIFTIDSSFRDEHINNIIYQSLVSNSSISIVIFGEHEHCKLSKLNDSRIYRICGLDKGKKIHYFEYIIKKFLPCVDENKNDRVLENFVSSFKKISEEEGFY